MVASSVLGTLPSWILVIMALAAAIKFGRSPLGASVADLEHSLERERSAHRETREKMGAEIRDLRVEVANLRGKTDVALAINAWGEQHEARAAERHIATLHVLDLIAARLGADAEKDA